MHFMFHHAGWTDDSSTLYDADHVCYLTTVNQPAYGRKSPNCATDFCNNLIRELAVVVAELVEAFSCGRKPRPRRVNQTIVQSIKQSRSFIRSVSSPSQLKKNT